MAQIIMGEMLFQLMPKSCPLVCGRAIIHFPSRWSVSLWGSSLSRVFCQSSHAEGPRFYFTYIKVYEIWKFGFNSLPLLSSSSFKKLTFFFSSSKSHEIILNDMVFYRSTLLQERINISRRRTLDIYIGRWRQWELTFSSEEVEIANREKLE